MVVQKLYLERVLVPNARLTADEGDDGSDYWRFESNHSTNKLNIATYAGGAWTDKVTITSSGNLTIPGDASVKYISWRWKHYGIF